MHQYYTHEGAFSVTDICDESFMDKPIAKMRRSTIMVTQSSSVITPVDMQKMLELGINAINMNLSHTTQEEKLRILGKLDKACVNCGHKNGLTDWPVASCVDLKTCVVRTGLLAEPDDNDYAYKDNDSDDPCSKNYGVNIVDSITIDDGSYVILSNNIEEYNSCNANKIFVDNACLTTEAKVGTEISIGEEEIILRCTEIVDDTSIKCVVLKGGELFDLDYVSMRGVERKRPELSKTDYQMIKFSLDYQVDMLMINYVNNAETLKRIKKFIKSKKVRRPYLISGICTQQGLDNIDDIMEESDAISLSREFLPFELDASKRFRLYRIQKWLGAKCQANGKPYLLSGDILEDSLTCGEYTDREVSDVTNALLDGVTGFILRATADTENILAAIKTLNHICRSIEPYTESKTRFFRVMDEIKLPSNAAEAIMLACVYAAYQCKSSAIIIPTVTGGTVRSLLRLNPPCLVITVSSRIKVNRLLMYSKCVRPLLYIGKPKTTFHQNVEAKIMFAVAYAINQRWLDFQDTYVTLQRGTEDSSFNDMIRIWPVTDYKRPMVECDDDRGSIPDEDYSVRLL